MMQACMCVLGVTGMALAQGPGETRTAVPEGAAIHQAGEVSPAGGSPLRLEYSCEDVGGGQYYYTFELIVDNEDGSFAPGQGWGWVIFGDQQALPTNLTDFVGDPASLPAGPFTQFQTSGGFHNGPTLGPISDGQGGFVYWFPSEVGESISWGGTSTAQLDDGELLFSSLLTTGGAIAPDFKAGVKVGGDDPCLADCNEDGELNVLDFVCYQGLFQSGDEAADCNDDGMLNVLDFVCFQGLFQEGCD